ncbi:MAG: 16S rRNA (guanine(527)-N(7))-methyltransferase RsmG [Tenericutes bacterium HGW-Tenericutes-3]|nr:MAG: 16S rRNA (guanine(527)-N(7))-methyltransferase RsmG [Tenericutes bacterium HGW-Tenericutes-3]
MSFNIDLEKNLSIVISDQQKKQFEIYFEFLIEYNKITNLTRITEVDEVYYKHFYDSLTMASTVNMNEIQTLCDMGSGAGFPSIPLKIIYPHLHITIVDSLNKRIIFLQKLIDKLEIDKVDLVHDRVEQYALTHQEQFDIVTARALGNLSLISEMGIPMTKIKGKFIALKGINYESELDESLNGIKILGGKVQDIVKYDLPYDYGTRYHIVINKNKHVKGYPRHFSIMSKKPL